MARVKWTPTAERDLTDIVLYISDHVITAKLQKASTTKLKKSALSMPRTPYWASVGLIFALYHPTHSGHLFTSVGW